MSARCRLDRELTSTRRASVLVSVSPVRQAATPSHCRALIRTYAFDSSVRSSTGDVWRNAIRQTPWPYFKPLWLYPGQTGRI